MKVAVLAGGRSSEHDVSLDSAAAVRAGREEAGHEVVDVRLSRDGAWHQRGVPLALHPGQGFIGCDVVWPVLHGPYGEDGTVQGLLELLDVPYVGAGVPASALCMDKLIFKDVMATYGIPQVEYALATPTHTPKLDFGFPVFVKPARLGSSVGIAKATSDSELAGAIASAHKHDPRVIVEAFSAGTEVECAVLGNDDAQASQPGEIVINADWYDYEAKYTPGGMELKVPAGIDDGARERVRELALEVFGIAGCSGLARVDFFVEDGGRVLVNELNTMPGFTQTSVYPKLWEASGLPFPDLCRRLVHLAVERHEAEKRYRF
jgi:D-alanine-D-alanine ligase